MTRSFVIAFAFLALFGVGCQTEDVPLLPTGEKSAWQETATAGVTRMERPLSSTSSAQIIVYRLDPARVSLRISAQTEPLTIAQWAEKEDKAALITNGVYFHEDYSPAGLLIAGGKSQGKTVFDWKRSAFISLAPTPEIFDTATTAVNTSSYAHAAQTYPFLVKNGVAALKEDSGLKARRTFFGTDASGAAYLGIVTGGAPTLFELQEALMTLPIKWRHAVNLDGGPSTGLFERGRGEHERLWNSQVSVPNVMIVEEKMP